MFDQVARNKRRTVLLVGLFVIFTFAVFVAAFHRGAHPVVLAAVAAAGTAAVAYWASGWVALTLSQARPAPREEYARLHNLVEGLCIAGAMPVPRIYVIDDDAPNAFATGRNPQHAAIAVTTGLLAMMNRVELEGVLAHELSHIKNHDILVATLAVTMVGAISIVTDLSSRPRSYRGRGRDGGGGGNGVGTALVVLSGLLLVVAPLVAQLMRFAVSRNRETLADLCGAELTRYPPGLASALEKLRDDTTVVRSPSRATAHLWIESPLPREKSQGRHARLNRLFDTHPPLDERITLLRQL
jgi:heat shock protein HtpX